MRNILSSMLVGALVLTGCGGAAKGPDAKSADNAKTDPHGNVVIQGAPQQVDKAAEEKYGAAIDSFVKADEKGEWTGICDAVAQQFLDAAAAQKSKGLESLGVAHYNAALAYQRCGKNDLAEQQFKEAATTKLFHAEAQLALIDFERSRNLDGAIKKLEEIVVQKAKFQYVEGLVSWAALLMEKGTEKDFEEAQKNLQRALAIDDASMPAFNQLALLYFTRAQLGNEKERKGGSRSKTLVVSGGEKKKLNQQQLDLAVLVTAQAQKKNANYAPIHNTAGLILVEQSNYNAAVKEFGAARKLDPRFFEAHMNYAAVNLGFRGFKEAENAYRDALKLQPKNFEAHLGLALALRGQVKLGASENAALVTEAQKELDAAKASDPSRPETYYNEAVLAVTKSKTLSGDQQLAALRDSIKRYQAFVGKAGTDARFAAAVKQSKTRVVDTSDIICFLLESTDAFKKKVEEALKANKEPGSAGPECDFVKAAQAEEEKKKKTPGG